MACGNVAPDCQAGDGSCRESFFLPEDGSATRGSNIWVLLIVFCSIPTVLIALVCLYVKQLKQEVGKDTAEGVTRTHSPMRGGPGPVPPRPNEQAAPFTDLGLQEANPMDISMSRQGSGSRGAAPPLPASSPRRDEQDSAALTPTGSRSAPPLPASRSFRNAAAAVRATSHMADAGADAGMARQMDADLEAGGGSRRLQSVHASQPAAHKHQLEAPEKLRTALDALADNQFDNCMYNLNLALWECAPMVAQPQGTLAVQLLQQAVLYKLCASVFRGVQTTAALMKQQTEPQAEPLPPHASRRQVLLCIFVCSLTDLQPKHRVRFIRRTIQLSMRNGNYGLAAPYIEYLMGLAQGRSRAKAEAELQQCREQRFENTADVPDLSRVDDVTNMGLDQSVAYLEQARDCAVAEAEDLASLGLAYHLLGDPAKSLECLEGSLAGTTPGGVDEAEVQASLCLAYHAVQQPQRADEAWARATEVYAAVTAGATQ